MIIVLLLVAATLCVDVVVALGANSHGYAYYNQATFFALLSAQLSIVCIGSGLRPRSNIWTRIAPFLAVVAVSLAFGFFNLPDFLEILPYFALHATLLYVLLWLFRRSRYWQRRSGIHTDWQFSIAQLLVTMTVVAVLAAALRHSNVFDNDTSIVVAFLGGTVLLTMAVVFVWSLSVHWFLRLACALVVAAMCGSLFLFWGYYILEFALLHCLVYTIVLVVWLAWGGILPVNRTRTVDTAA